jgi:hypothetical protein
MSTPLSDRLRAQEEEYGNHDKQWRDFIYDHKGYLLHRAEQVDIDPSTAYFNRTQLRLLMKQLGLPITFDWIVIILNQLGDTDNYRYIRELKIPKRQDIDLLREQYTTLQVA